MTVFSPTLLPTRAAGETWHRPGSPALVAGGLLLLAAAGAGAAPCNEEPLLIDRGETRRLVLCVAGLPAQYRLELPSGVRASYDQRLRHCGIGRKEPGVQLVLTADTSAASGTLAIRQADTGAPVCEATPLTVPDRIVLPDARLTRHSDGALTLALRAPAGVDLTPSCTQALSFGGGDGLALAARPDARPSRCSRNRLQMPVQAFNERPQPARVILPAVRLADGSTTEAVAFPVAPAPAWQSAMSEADAKYVDVGGVRTRYFDKGRGEALLLVHGGQPSSMDGTAWDWQQNFDELAKHFHVYALDRIGQGYTDHPADLNAYKDYYPLVVRHVQGFMDAVGIRRAHLVGHSQGSWPVTRIALDHPDRVASLTLVDGTMVAPSRDGGSAIKFYLYLTQDLHPKAGETLESVRRGMEFFSYTGNNLTDQRVTRLLAMTRQAKYPVGQDVFAKSGMSPAHPAFRALKKQIVSELEAGKLEVPVLVVWGGKDPEGSLPSGLELFHNVSQGNRRARLHVFGDSGHLSFIEHPAEFNRLLTDFATGAD